MNQDLQQRLLAPFGWDERFFLVEIVGAGGAGQVWKAKEPKAGRWVALKFLAAHRLGDVSALARMEGEGQTLQRLQSAGRHPNVVPVLDFAIKNDQACLVMEFIPGRTLAEVIAEDELGFEKIVSWLATIARACGWFHQLGVVHRDLKPQNILIHAETGEPIVIDFSIAKDEELMTLTLTHQALGTASYMAPEQFGRARGGITPAADVYSLGVILYEWLTQTRPHPGDFHHIMQRHSEEVRPAPPSVLNPAVSRDLECIILKALTPRVTERYADGSALAADLERFLAGEPVLARPLSALTRLARRARRKPALTAALAACLALAGYALGNARHQAVQREKFTLETALNKAMQHGTWSAAELEQAETTLTVLDKHDAKLAAEMRQRVLDDISRDMEVRLQQIHLRDEDYIWLRDTAAWLAPHTPEQARHLQSLISQRIGRWQKMADLRAPFADMQGLFSQAKVRVERDLLFPVYERPSEKPASYGVTASVTVPMEAACTFVAEPATFRSITLVFYHGLSRLAVGIYKMQHLSESIRRSLRLPEGAPQSYALIIRHNDDFSRALHIPDTHLLDRPFRFTLWVENAGAEAEINDQWALRVDTPFVFGSVEATNRWFITWPHDIGLKQLTLRTRRADTASPLEQADLLAAQKQWAGALRLYEGLRGDPVHGLEVDYKIAECHLRKGDHHAACSIWERLIQGPPSQWRDRSLIQLWLQSILHHDQAAVSRYLTLLPDPLPPAMSAYISPRVADEIAADFIHVGLGVALPRLDATAIFEAAKTYRLLNISAVQTASRFALAHHCARLEQESHKLYWNGLSDPAASSGSPADILAATNCLDQWCRITPSEKNDALAESLTRWQKARINDPTVQAIWSMEQSRRAARKGNWRAAMTHVLDVTDSSRKEPGKFDNRVHTSALLLEGVLRRQQGIEAKAQGAWAKGLEVASTVTMKHTLYLCDSILLHSLAQKWDARAMGDVLAMLARRHLKAEESTATQAAFNQTFLSDPAWITTLNTVLQDESGRQFAMDYALCRQPPGELVQRFYRLLFEHHFRTSLSRATPAERGRVRGIVDQLVTEMTMNPRGEISHLYAYLRAWNDPAAAQTLLDQAYPYSSALIENMKWLLDQRHR